MAGIKYIALVYYEYRVKRDNETWADDLHIWKQANTPLCKLADTKEQLEDQIQQFVLRPQANNTQYRNHAVQFAEAREKFSVVIKTEYVPYVDKTSVEI